MSIKWPTSHHNKYIICGGWTTAPIPCPPFLIHSWWCQSQTSHYESPAMPWWHQHMSLLLKWSNISHVLVLSLGNSNLGWERKRVKRVISLDRHRLCLLRVLNGVDLCTGTVPLTLELLTLDLLTPHPRGKVLTSRISLRSLDGETHTWYLTDEPAERAKQFDHISSLDIKHIQNRRSVTARARREKQYIYSMYLPRRVSRFSPELKAVNQINIELDSLFVIKGRLWIGR